MKKMEETRSVQSIVLVPNRIRPIILIQYGFEVPKFSLVIQIFSCFPAFYLKPNMMFCSLSHFLAFSLMPNTSKGEISAYKYHYNKETKIMQKLNPNRT